MRQFASFFLTLTFLLTLVHFPQALAADPLELLSPAPAFHPGDPLTVLPACTDLQVSWTASGSQNYSLAIHQYQEGADSYPLLQWFDNIQSNSLSIPLERVPSDGQIVYFRLAENDDDQEAVLRYYQASNFDPTQCDTPVSEPQESEPLDLLTPQPQYYSVNPQALPSTALDLSWHPTANPEFAYYALSVGSAPGTISGLTSGNGWFQTSQPQITLENLPNNGENIHIRLFAYNEQNQTIEQLKDYTFLAYNSVLDPNPNPNPEPEPDPADPNPNPNPNPTPDIGSLSGIWANSGEHKITKDQLLLNQAPQSTINSIWNGEQINLFSAKNEIVSFNLILEAANSSAQNVNISLDSLTGPNGYTLNNQPYQNDSEQLYQWLDRQIELFFVRYLPIEGLSLLSYDNYDQRHIPERLRAAWSVFPGTQLGRAIPHHLYFSQSLDPQQIDTIVYYFDNRDNIETNDSILTETSPNSRVFTGQTHLGDTRITLLETTIDNGFNAQISVRENDQYQTLNVYPFTPHWRSGMFTAPQAFNDRPDANKLYPEIAVPLELENNFSIPQGQNQSIWGDIYIPKDAPAGFYTGTITVEQSQTTINIPVTLEVKNFTLPDEPHLKTMLYFSNENLQSRYGQSTLALRNKHFMLAHRHKISLVDSGVGQGQPNSEWIPRLNGSLYTASNGYQGPGENTGNNLFSIGTYGALTPSNITQALLVNLAQTWENWFSQNFPEVEHFLYLIDEPGPEGITRLNTWLSWLDGQSQIPTLATVSAPTGQSQTPLLSIAPSWIAFAVGGTALWEQATDHYLNSPDKKLYFYNGKRPANGSFATEDDGVALRQLAWSQFKKQVDRWFFWESTYYNNFQGGTGQTDVFTNAHTFGSYNPNDPRTFQIGKTGWNYSNGDGVLFYPGTDLIYPQSSYNISGPFTSLRLKHWRRGIQDGDYLKMAQDLGGEQLVQNLLDHKIPETLWDLAPTSSNDPTYIHSDISWSTNPDSWENSRQILADFIEQADNSNPSQPDQIIINGDFQSGQIEPFFPYGRSDNLQIISENNNNQYLYFESQNNGGIQYQIQNPLRDQWYLLSFRYKTDSDRLRSFLTLPTLGKNSDLEGLYLNLPQTKNDQWRTYFRPVYLPQSPQDDLFIRIAVKNGWAQIDDLSLTPISTPPLVIDGDAEHPDIGPWWPYGQPETLEKQNENNNTYIQISGNGGTQMIHIPVTAGQTYTISFDYQFQGDRFRTNLNLASVNKQGDFEPLYRNIPITSNNQWSTYTRTFQIPENNTDPLRIIFAIRNGDLKIDNLQLTPQ